MDLPRLATRKRTVGHDIFQGVHRVSELMKETYRQLKKRIIEKSLVLVEAGDMSSVCKAIKALNEMANLDPSETGNPQEEVGFFDEGTNRRDSRRAPLLTNRFAMHKLVCEMRIRHPSGVHDAVYRRTSTFMTCLRANWPVGRVETTHFGSCKK